MRLKLAIIQEVSVLRQQDPPIPPSGGKHILIAPTVQFEREDIDSVIPRAAQCGCRPWTKIFVNQKSRVLWKSFHEGLGFSIGYLDWLPGHLEIAAFSTDRARAAPVILPVHVAVTPR